MTELSSETYILYNKTIIWGHNVLVQMWGGGGETKRPAAKCPKKSRGETSWVRNIQVQNVRGRNVLVKISAGVGVGRGKRPDPKYQRAKRPGPKRQGAKRPGSKLQGGESTWSQVISGSFLRYRMQITEKRNFMDIFYINCFSHSLYLSRARNISCFSSFLTIVYAICSRN